MTIVDIFVDINLEGVKYEIKTVEIDSKDTSVLIEINILNDKSVELVLSMENKEIVSLKVEKKGTKKENNLTVTVSIPDTLTAKIYLKETVAYNKNISKKYVSKSVNANDLTELESTEIENNLMNTAGVKRLLEKVDLLSLLI